MVQAEDTNDVAWRATGHMSLGCSWIQWALRKSLGAMVATHRYKTILPSRFTNTMVVAGKRSCIQIQEKA